MLYGLVSLLTPNGITARKHAMIVHRAPAILSVLCGILLAGAGLADTERETSAEQDDRVSLTFTGIPIQEAIGLFAQKTGVDIIDASGGVDRRNLVSANIVDKPWRLALETVLEQCNLKLVERPPDSGIFVVLPGDAAKAKVDQEAQAGPGITGMLAGFGVVAILSVLGFVVNLLFGVAVWADGVRLRREGRRAFLLTPVL